MSTHFELNYNLNPKYETIIEHISTINYDEVDWYNLENEIDKLLDEYKLPDDVAPLIEYYLEKRFKLLRKNSIAPNDLNVVSLLILVEMILTTKQTVQRLDIEKQNYPITSVIKGQVNKSLKYFEEYHVLQRVIKDKMVYYELNLEKWFKQSTYYIGDVNVLKELAPIIIAYVKNGNIKHYNIEILFKKISEVIEFAIRPSTLHNNRFELEEKILSIIEENKWNTPQSVDIINDSKDKEVSIVPKRIIYEENEKYIISDIVDENFNTVSKDEKIPLYEYGLSNSYIQASKAQSVHSSHNLLLNANKAFSSNLTIDTKETEVLIEADSVVYEYYKMKPMKQMKIYDTEELKKEIISELKRIDDNAEIKENKFYITAMDDKEKILSTVLHTLSYVRVIEPKQLNKELIDRFMSYADDVNMNPCPKNDEDNQDNSDNNPSPDGGGNNSSSSTGTVKQSKNNKELTDEEKRQLHEVTKNPDFNLY